MATIRQTNFLGGELDPLLWGRNDMAVFGRGLRTMRNFFAGKQGAAVSRPGSVFIGEAKVTNPNHANVRLVPFVYSDTESYVLEVGHTGAEYGFYVRMYRNGERLRSSAFGPDPVDATKWALFEVVRPPNTLGWVGVDQLRWAQVGDVLTFTHPNMRPLELRRRADWTDGELSVIKAKALAAGNAAVAADTSGVELNRNEAFVEAFLIAYEAYHPVPAFFAPVGFTEYYPHTQAKAAAEAAGSAAGGINSAAYRAAYGVAYGITYATHVSGTPHWTLSEVSYEAPQPFFVDLDHTYLNLYEPEVVSPPPGQEDDSHPAREWVWLVTTVAQHSESGRLVETLPHQVRFRYSGSLTDAYDGQTALSTSQVVYPDRARTLRIAPGVGGVPPTWSTEGYHAIAYNVYRGRGNLFGFVGQTKSRDFVDVGAEPNYAIPPPRGENPFASKDQSGNAQEEEKPFAVAFFEERCSFAGTFRRPAVILFSAVGDYSNFDRHELIHTSGEALNFELASRRHERIQHLLWSGKLLVFTQSSVWSVGGANGAALDFDSVDARMVDEVGAIGLPPLVVDGTVLFARAKGPGVRGLRLDQGGFYRGVDLSLVSNHLFSGYSRDEFDGRLKYRTLKDWTYAEDPWGLVWAVRDDGALLSLTLNESGAGWARHDGSLNPDTGRPMSWYRSVCSVPEGSEDAVYVLVSRQVGFVGSDIEATASPFWESDGSGTSSKLCVERMTSRVRNGVGDDGCVDCAYFYDGPVVSQFTGLTHLAGNLVYAIATDNPVQGPLRVSDAGVLDLPVTPTANAGVAGDQLEMYVGLLYECDLETLDVSAAEAKLKKKTVLRVGFEVDNSTGVKAGQDFEHLVDTRPHDVASGYDPPVPGTALLTVVPTRKWDSGGRAVLRQSLPLPITVTGLVRELDVGG